MWKFILKRFLSMIIVVLASALIIFTLLYFTPADPADAMLGFGATQAERDALRESLGLNKSYWAQLADFMYNTFIKLDLGTSWATGLPVWKDLLERIPRTLAIGIPAMIINLAIGIFLGIRAGVNVGKYQDSLIMGLVMILLACPNFWVAMLLIILFSQTLGWLPSYGIGGIEYYILPIISSALAGIAVNTRFERNSIVEVLRSDFVVTARAKGLPEKTVIYRHMLPNALMPTITNVGRILAAIVAGSPIIERVFSIPGVGLYLLTAINQRDYPAVRGCVLFFAVFVSVIMVLVDIVYAYIDPRIKAQFSK